MKVFTDSDWAGCLRTRRSTSGGLTMVVWHPLRRLSSAQSATATSSAVAELHSAAEGLSRGLGLQSVLRGMGVSARIGIVNRLFVVTSVRIHSRTYAQSGGDRLVAPVFGERRPNHIEDDLWQPQRVGISVLPVGSTDWAEGRCILVLLCKAKLVAWAFSSVTLAPLWRVAFRHSSLPSSAAHSQKGYHWYRVSQNRKGSATRMD